MVTDGDNWKFGIVDLIKKKVYFSRSRRLTVDTNLVDLMALISIWTGKPVSRMNQIMHIHCVTLHDSQSSKPAENHVIV
jgi:hypothetical protein